MFQHIQLWVKKNGTLGALSFSLLMDAFTQTDVIVIYLCMCVYVYICIHIHIIVIGFDPFHTCVFYLGSVPTYYQCTSDIMIIVHAIFTLFALFRLYLVGGFRHREIWRIVSWDHDSQLWKSFGQIKLMFQTAPIHDQKPPTRYYIIFLSSDHSIFGELM